MSICANSEHDQFHKFAYLISDLKFMILCHLFFFFCNKNNKKSESINFQGGKIQIFNYTACKQKLLPVLSLALTIASIYSSLIKMWKQMDHFHMYFVLYLVFLYMFSVPLSLHQCANNWYRCLASCVTIIYKFRIDSTSMVFSLSCHLITFFFKRCLTCSL